jgi:hypothetical protein
VQGIIEVISLYDSDILRHIIVMQDVRVIHIIRHEDNSHADNNIDDRVIQTDYFIPNSTIMKYAQLTSVLKVLKLYKMENCKMGRYRILDLAIFVLTTGNER